MIRTALNVREACHVALHPNRCARASAMHEGLTASDVHQVAMPSFHTNARTYSILPTMWAGGTVVLQPKFSARRWWDVALRNKCTWASMIPFFVKALMEQELPPHHFRMFGFAANEPLFDPFFRVRTIGWWGMTETVSQGIVGDALTPNRSMTTGRPAAIMAECKSKLADFKRPREVFLVSELPRSTLEKVSKVDLRKRLPVAG